MPPPKSKGGKMLSLINWRLKVTINDGRALTGQMLAFDRHMNLVLADCEEFRRVRTKKKGDEGPAQEQELKRTLGLVILRGETVVSLSVEGPPPVVDEDKSSTLPVGPGRGMPAGRGMGMMAPMGGPPMGGFPPMGGAPPGFRPPGMPPGMPFPPPGFGGPPPGFQPPQ